MSAKLKGVGVALVTPFHKDGSIDFKSFKSLIEHTIAGKVDYLVPLGSTGEAATLNKDEKRAVLDFVKEENNGRLPIVVGYGGNNTRDLLDCLMDGDFDDVDAILSVSPAYNKPTQKGIYNHYKMISESSPVPIILYNVPGRTGSNISADTTLSLASDFKNIIGIKEASGNFDQFMQIFKNRPKNFLMISGDDTITLPFIALGGDGVISVVANAYPKEFSTMVHHAIDGNFADARKMHYKLLDITNSLFIENNPAGIKMALNLLDITQEHLRMPLMTVSKATQNKMAALMGV
ncbi:MAG: 4-hydroxy-tetrahydrodipicolinate synthase [Bacteroidota bacterium]